MLDAVGRLLDRRGVAGLSLSAIAAEAGISRVTLHRRGATVERLVIAVVGRVSDELREALWPVLTASGPAVDRLEQALLRLCRVAEDHAGVLSAIYRLPVRALPDRPERTTSLEFVEPFQRLLEDGRQDGTLHSDDPAPEAALLANAVVWSYLHMRQAHDWPPEEAAGRVIAMAMAGHRAGPADR